MVAAHLFFSFAFRILRTKYTFFTTIYLHYVVHCLILGLQTHYSMNTLPQDKAADREKVTSTVVMPHELWREAKLETVESGTTLNQLLVDGLRRELSQRKRQSRRT